MDSLNKQNTHIFTNIVHKYTVLQKLVQWFVVNIQADMLIASRTFLRPTEMGTEKDGIFAQYDLLQQKYFRKNN